MDCGVVRMPGPDSRSNSFLDRMRNFGILEMVRTGRVALARGFNSVTREMEVTPGWQNGNGHRKP